MSLYLSAALIKIISHLGILVVLTSWINQSKKFWSLDTLAIASLVTVFFQYSLESGYYAKMGIIDGSVVYAFSYAFAFIFVLLYMQPFYMAFMGRRSFRFSIVKHIVLALFALAVVFNGPLNAPSILIITSLSLGFYGLYHFRQARASKGIFSRIITSIQQIPASLLGHFIWIFILALYSFYLGTFNIENPENAPVLLERYKLLAKGIFLNFIYDQHISPFLYLGLGILFNWGLIYWNKIRLSAQQQQVYLFLIIFCILYLLLLPLGGYRSYRPHIVRLDVILPITLSFIYIFVDGCYTLVKSGELKLRYAYAAFPLLFMLYFSLIDVQNMQDNDCEERSLEKIANATEAPVTIEHCAILGWSPIYDPGQSYYESLMLQRWGVTKERVPYSSAQ